MLFFLKGWYKSWSPKLACKYLKKYIPHLKLSLMKTFSLFLTTGIFLDKMKIAKDSQVHKSGKIYLVKSPTNFRSFLLFKKLEWIICNRIVNLIVLFNKQFGFWLFWLFNKICTNKVSWSYVPLFLGVSIDHHGLNRIDLDTKRLKTKMINDNNYNNNGNNNDKICVI